jgi:hypothetical protein
MALRSLLWWSMRVMSPFDAAYWDDEYQTWLQKHELYTRRLEVFIFIFMFVVGFLVGVST